MSRQKIIRFISAIVLVGAALVLLGFVGKIRNSAPCTDIDIHIASLENFSFVERSTVERAITSANASIIGSPLAQIDLRNIEEQIERLPSVKDAQVYHTINNKLKVEVVERTPILRLIDPTGQGCYVDKEGNFMPLSPNYSARVLVATGDFILNLKAVNDRASVYDSLSGQPFPALYEFTAYTVSDSLWKAQVQHVYYHRSRGIIAIPRVGSHEICFGKAINLEDKFNRLKIFYQHGLNASNWNSYQSINLNYKDQIVCTKK